MMGLVDWSASVKGHRKLSPHSANKGTREICSSHHITRKTVWWARAGSCCDPSQLLSDLFG